MFKINYSSVKAIWGIYKKQGRLTRKTHRQIRTKNSLKKIAHSTEVLIQEKNLFSNFEKI